MIVLMKSTIALTEIGTYGIEPAGDEPERPS
jgi:hypothetical protein